MTAVPTRRDIVEEARANPISSNSDSADPGWAASELYPPIDPAILASQNAILGQATGSQPAAANDGQGQAETFVFHPLNFNTMVVKPQNDTSNIRHRYNISIQMNHFIPTSFITTVRRGGTETGQFVGDFEIGITRKPATICVRGKEFPLDTILTKKGSRTAAVWAWQLKTTRGLPSFTWDCTFTPYTCRPLAKDQSIIAKFSPAKRQRPLEPGVIALPLAQMEVFAGGREYFDDLLMSILIIERKRLTPKKEPLFNFP